MPWDDWQPWQPWIAQEGATWPLWAYNVRLYPPDPDPPIPDARDRALWRDLNAKRIDAVGYRADRYTIVEARRVSGYSAIGQLIGYQDLWRLHFPALALEALVLVTESIDAAIRMSAQLHGIRVWTPTG